MYNELKNLFAVISWFMAGLASLVLLIISIMGIITLWEYNDPTYSSAIGVFFIILLFSAYATYTCFSKVFRKV